MKTRLLWLGIISAIVIAGAALTVSLRTPDKRAETPATQLRWQSANLQSRQTYLDLLARDAKHDWTYPSVSVYSIAYTPPAPAALSLKDLSDNGQAHAIDFLLKKMDATRGDRKTNKASLPDDPQTTLHGLIAAISAQSDAMRVDPYRANRVLIATVAKGLNTQPGDRILWTRIFVKPINFRFAGYSVVASDKYVVKIATVENTTQTKLTVKAASPGIDGVSVGSPELSKETDRSQKTTADINQAYENLGVDIHPDFMRIIRESAKDGDVAGNMTVQLSMVTDPVQIIVPRFRQMVMTASSRQKTEQRRLRRRLATNSVC